MERPRSFGPTATQSSSGTARIESSWSIARRDSIKAPIRVGSRAAAISARTSSADSTALATIPHAPASRKASITLGRISGARTTQGNPARSAARVSSRHTCGLSGTCSASNSSQSKPSRPYCHARALARDSHNLPHAWTAVRCETRYVQSTSDRVMDCVDISSLRALRNCGAARRS
jgi:hypothetical protein